VARRGLKSRTFFARKKTTQRKNDKDRKLEEAKKKYANDQEGDQITINRRKKSDTNIKK
jgi:hypothetical protein